MHLLEIQPRKIKQGNGDLLVINLDFEEILQSGIIEREAIDISKWRFSMLVHEKVEYSCKTKIFEVRGTIPNGKNGQVYFQVPDEYTDIKPGTYWYSIQYIRENGKPYRTLSSKYIIVESLNDYFSIYNK